MNWKTSIAAVAALLVAASSGLTGTLCVNPAGTGGCYTTIQAAIAAAASGDTIDVQPGTYVEAVTINKNVVLWADGDPCSVRILPSAGRGISFLAGSTGARVVGFLIESPDSYGVYCDQAVTIYVDNCVIQRCAGDGIRLSNSNGWYWVSNCVMHANSGWGIYIYDGNGYFYSNIVDSNRQGGLYRYGFASCVTEDNCYFANSPSNFGGGVGAGSGDLTSSNPQFVLPSSCSFHLQASSPCIDQGRSGFSYQDCDGTTNDMGVYGGPRAYCNPGPVVTNLILNPSTVVSGETFQIQATGTTR